MSFVTPSPQDCCAPCPAPVVTNIPGPQGPAGPAGTDGTNGANAFTTTTLQFAMPAEGDLVAVNVADSSWMTVGQVVAVGLYGSASFGYFQVDSKPSGAVAVLKNIANTGAGDYLVNSAPGTVFASGSSVSPAGLQGPGGAAGGGGAPADASYVTQVSEAALTGSYALAALPSGLLKVTNGTGASGVALLDTSNGGQAPNDGALTSGQAVFASASGIQTKSASDARTALGLGTMATQDANAVNITGGTISGVALPAPSGLPQYWTTFRNQQASATGGGDATAGSWIDVPINTLGDNYGGFGAYAATGIMRMQAGTYRVEWLCPMYLVNAFKTRLWNNTAGSVVGYGSNAKAGSSDTTTAMSAGALRITVGATTDFKLQAWVTTANTGSSNAFGVATGEGSAEVYQQVIFVKES